MFIFDKALIPPNHIPVVLLSEALNDIQKAEIELAENVVRLKLPWQDRIAALAYIHNIKRVENPNQTIMDTARAIIAKGARELSGAQGGAAESTMLRNVKQATIISAHLDKPEDRESPQRDRSLQPNRRQ